MTFASLLAAQFFNGLVIGLIYILIAIGLSIIFGMLDIVNFAHGAFYAFGAYIGYTLALFLNNFWLALVFVPLAVGLLGIGIEVFFLRRMYGGEQVYQILLTFGLALIIQEMIIIIWGPVGKSIATPESLTGVANLWFFLFPKYRLFLIIFTGSVIVGAIIFIEKTRFGAIIRAGTEHADMVNCLGIDLSKVFTATFGVGAGFAGLAGVLAIPMRGATPLMGDSVLVLSFVVIVIGGMGSLKGAVLGGLIIGLVQSMMTIVWPAGSNIMIFAAMALIILMKPQGLMGIR